MKNGTLFQSKTVLKNQVLLQTGNTAVISTGI